MEIIIVLISRLSKKDAFNLIENAVIIDKKRTFQSKNKITFV